MASLYKRKKFTVITIVYWFLLTYIVTALIFWFLSLVRQSTQMSEYKLLQLKKDAPDYSTRVNAIEDEERRKIAQYIGEGSTFLLLILVGAVFVYQATRRQILLSTQQQNFMMAITHELKTPIAITKLNIETLLKRKLEEPQQEKLLNNALQESNRLNDLCDNILLASQIDAGDYLPDKERINLGELVEESTAYFNTRFPYQLIEETIEENIYVKGDRLLLQLAVNNLIENAIKYSGKQKPVTILLQKSNTETQLLVKDLGKGIARQEKKKVFEKFYRAGDENTRNTKGTGLGLYLTKKIIKDHNGNITVQDNTPSGCIFAISLHTTS